MALGFGAENPGCMSERTRKLCQAVGCWRLVSMNQPILTPSFLGMSMATKRRQPHPSCSGLSVWVCESKEIG